MAANENGLTLEQGQPVKTITKCAAYFIANWTIWISCLPLVLAVAMALPDIFQSIDWAGLVALGGVMSTPNTTPAVFTGTDNPRHLRVIQALMTRPLPREQLDKVAGCSNGPELVAELRRRGLDIECTRTKKKDRDLFDCWPGVYHFTTTARRRVIQWLAKRKAGGVNNA